MDAVAREEMIVGNLPLVRRIVVHVTTTLPPGVDRDDLESAGVIGLIKAVDRYDPHRGVKFVTYASQLIRGEVMESLRARDWAPRSLRRRSRELTAAVAELQREFGRPPADDQVAERLGVPLQQYHRLISQISGVNLVSLDEVTDMGVQTDGENSAELAIAEPDGNPLEKLAQEERKELLALAVEGLPEREKLIVALYYQEGLSLKEIGHVLGVTESRVCQIHTQAMSRLRKALAD
jgi:RNA polymerase sigma factor FliA